MSKKVLIVSRRLVRKNKLINWVSEIYASILCSYDVLPIFVPIADSTLQVLPEYLADYDGLLMMEGGDINPVLYGSSYDSPEEFDPIKDEIETQCFVHAYTNNKSILGFCRGLHVINVMLGGTLHSDVHEYNNNSMKHIDYEHYDELRHKIIVDEKSWLYSCFKEKELMVNSYHHQGIQTLASDLVPMAKSDDGLIEAVVAPQKKFVVGLQFHPERMLAEYDGCSKVFELFVKSL